MYTVFACSSRCFHASYSPWKLLKYCNLNRYLDFLFSEIRDQTTYPLLNIQNKQFTVELKPYKFENLTHAILHVFHDSYLFKNWGRVENFTHWRHVCHMFILKFFMAGRNYFDRKVVHLRLKTIGKAIFLLTFVTLGNSY